MSKSSFNALVEAKKQRDGAETETATQNENLIKDKLLKKKTAQKGVPPKTTKSVDGNNQIENLRPSKRETVRRSYRVDEPHDKAVKVMSKFMGQGTEEEIVLSIFAYFFENNADGKKAMQMVELLDSK
ncbi:MAG: hypothetical protein ABI891_11580 [Acidobacteriota bacterium]